MQKPGKTDSNLENKLFVLTGIGRKLLKTMLISILILAAVSMLIFNWHLLLDNPFSVELRWDNPILVKRNIHGVQVVADRNGKRLVILDPTDRIQAILNSNRLSKRAINSVSDIAVDDKYLYVLDLQHSRNGAQIDGERVLVYTLNGKYVDCIYELSHPDANQREYVLCSVSCYNGKVFVTKRSFEEVTVYQILGKKLQEIRKFTFPGKEIFDVAYMPETKSTFVVTRDACCYLDYQNNLEKISRTDSTTLWSAVGISPSGERYYLDTNRHEIIQFRPNVKEKKILQFSSRNEIRKISDTSGLYFSLQDDTLSWCCSSKNQVISLQIPSQQKTISEKAMQPLNYQIFRWIVWSLAVFLVIFILRKTILFLIWFIRQLRNSSKPGEISDPADKEIFLPFFRLYGKNIAALTFAFLAVSFVLSAFFMQSYWKFMESSVKSTACELRDLPGSTFGDYLARIDCPSDYNSKAFKLMRQVGSSICFSTEGAEFDLGLSVIRKLPNGKYMYVIDTHDACCIGKIIDDSDPDQANMFHILNQVKDDELLCQDGTLKNAKSAYCVFTGIRNSDGKTVGYVIISCNKEKIFSETRAVLFKLSVDLLLLFIIFTFMSGELALIWEFRKQRKLDSRGKLQQTVCEGHRICNSLTVMSLYLDAAFLPTLTLELAKRSGVNGSISFLAALPLTFRNVMLVAALVLGGFLAKYNPGKFLKCSAVFSIVVYLFQIHSVSAGQFQCFMAGIAALGVMTGLKFASLDAISASGLQPDAKFKNLVFVNTECLIGAAVGTSLGSLLCAKFGYTAVFLLGIVLELRLLIMTGFFITDDINQKRIHSWLNHPKQTLLAERLKFKNNIRHILRPELLALLFFVMVPICILGQFDSFVLPIYNAWSGYSVLLTGFVGTVTKVLALILIPRIFHKLAAHGNRMPILVGMAFLIAGLLFFACDNTLLVFAILLLIITAFNIVFTTTAERLRLAIAQEDHVKYSDVVGFFHVFQYFGASVAPLMLGYCLKFGFTVFSLIFAGLLLVLLILFFCFSGHFRRTEIGKCL